MDEPLSQRVGPSAWALLHWLAVEHGDLLPEIVPLWISSFPCRACSRDAAQLIKKVPLRSDSWAWSVDFHNAVNKKLRKPLFDGTKEPDADALLAKARGYFQTCWELGAWTSELAFLESKIPPEVSPPRRGLRGSLVACSKCAIPSEPKRVDPILIASLTGGFIAVGAAIAGIVQSVQQKKKTK